MSLWLKGAMAGLSIAAPVGAIGFLCIQQTLQSGIAFGIASGLGAATADTMYGILVALGVTVGQAFLLHYQGPLTVIGGLFLCYLGIKKIRSTLPTQVSKEASLNESLVRSYGVTFLLTLINPTTILDFMALFTSLQINAVSYADSLSFVGGVFLGSAAWWFMLCFTVGCFRKRISTQVLQYINYIAGAVIFSFGIYALSKFWR